MILEGLRFQMTCFACPEQYDVLDENDNIVGYIRLRHGHLTMQPRPGGIQEFLYEHDFDDPWLGVFPNDDERIKHLRIIAKILRERIDR